MLCWAQLVWLFEAPWTARLLCLCDSPGKDTGVGCLSLLQRIFLTQGLNRNCRQTLYHLSQNIEWVNNSDCSCVYIQFHLNEVGDDIDNISCLSGFQMIMQIETSWSPVVESAGFGVKLFWVGVLTASMSLCLLCCKIWVMESLPGSTEDANTIPDAVFNLGIFSVFIITLSKILKDRKTQLLSKYFRAQ